MTALSVAMAPSANPMSNVAIMQISGLQNPNFHFYFSFDFFSIFVIQPRSQIKRRFIVRNNR